MSYVENRHPWTKKLAERIEKWLTLNSIGGRGADITFTGFAKKLGITPRQLKGIRVDKLFQGDTEVYFRIWTVTRLDEADPRSIPQTDTGVRRAWSDREIAEWITSHVEEYNRLLELSRQFEHFEENVIVEVRAPDPIEQTLQLLYQAEAILKDAHQVVSLSESLEEQIVTTSTTLLYLLRLATQTDITVIDIVMETQDELMVALWSYLNAVTAPISVRRRDLEALTFSDEEYGDE